MPSQLLPGRPGNLTAEQEASLREFWRLTLGVHGVHDPNAPAPTSPVLNGATSSDPKESKKRKGRLGIFGRRRGEKEGKEKDGDGGTTTPDSVASSTPAIASAAKGNDGNDKYGQTKAFKDALADSSAEEIREAFWGMVKHDDPDALLLRFLRARKWDVQAALVMAVSTMRWRMSEIHVDDDIMWNGEGAAARDSTNDANPGVKKEAEDFLSQLRLGKGFIHGLDAEGRPMCFVRVRLHRQGEQSQSSLERHTVYTIETARMLLRGATDTATIVFDMTNFSMANMDYPPVKFMIKCFEANYPESLSVILVHKAPWIFQGIWNIIRGWLDPVVAAKIQFTKNIDELANYVPRSNIPKELGGDEDWEYKYPEVLPDENKAMADSSTREAIQIERDGIVRQYEDATLAWIAAASGNEAEKTSVDEVKGRRRELARQLEENYWRLDPYVRARSYVDRFGVLGSGSSLQFYPKKDEKVAVQAVDTADDDVD